MNNAGDRAAALLPFAIACAAALSGCNAEPATKTIASRPAVALQLADAADLRRVLDNHRGSVVLVDFWATWCGPCVEQFPHTVQLAEKLRDRGLAVVSVSMDSPSTEPHVRAFLEKHQARFDNLLSSYDSPVTATKEFRLPGPVPCYRVYDRQGRLHREFAVDPRAAKQFTPADVDAAVEELL
jgi:thiol-disulfide isomerase/thioredoxin